MLATASVLTLTAAAAIAVAQPVPPVPPTPPTPAVGIVDVTGGSWLGVGMMEVDAQTSLELDLDDPHGVQITQVIQGSPAAEGGLQNGDVITGYRGTRVEGVAHFARLVRETPVGREVELEVHSNSGERTLTVQIGERRQAAGVRRIMESVGRPAANFDIARPRMVWRSRSLGVELETLEGQLATYFGVDDGVLVRSVEANSGAAKSDLKAGDVILAIDGRRISRPNQVGREISRADAGAEVEIEIMRNRRAQTLKAPVNHFTIERVFPGHSVSIADPGF